VAYWVQPAATGQKKIDVIAVTVALDVLARYEALFRSRNFHPGLVMPSSLAALQLFRAPGVGMFARLAGNVLTVVVTRAGRLRLYRCLEIESPTDWELLSVLQPTFAFVEDEIGQPVDQLSVCGLPHVPVGLPVTAEPLRSRLAQVNGYNAGLLGYLESLL
jgi:type IV pilus assembly protein PilM